MNISNSKIIIGVMGPAEAEQHVLDDAYNLGKLLASHGYIVLTGGTNKGVMDHALKGAKNGGGQTIGILIDNHLDNMSQHVDIPIVTGLGSARNNINVLTSAIIVACGIGAGTTSEIALALKANKEVILLNSNQIGNEFFKSIGGNKVFIADCPNHAFQLITAQLKEQSLNS